METQYKHDSVSILYHTHCDDAAMYYNTVAAVHHCILRGTYVILNRMYRGYSDDSNVSGKSLRSILIIVFMNY